MTVIAFPNKEADTFHDHKIDTFKTWALTDIEEKIEPGAQPFFNAWVNNFFSPTVEVPKEQFSRLVFDTFFMPVSKNCINLNIRIMVTINICSVTLIEDCPEIVGFSNKNLIDEVFTNEKFLPPTVPFSGLISLLIMLDKEGYRLVNHLQKKTDSSVFYTLAKPGSRMVLLELKTGAIEAGLGKLKKICNLDLFTPNGDGE